MCMESCTLDARSGGRCWDVQEEEEEVVTHKRRVIVVGEGWVVGKKKERRTERGIKEERVGPS